MDFPEYTIEDARNSAGSLLPRLFAYIDYRLIGTHENTREANTSAVYKAINEQGYKGPALSVFFAGDDRQLQNLKLDSLIEGEYGVVGIADGHNRLEAIRLLDEDGLLSSGYIPVQVIPAHDPDLVRISTRDESDPALPVREIERHFNTPESVITTINSYFEAKLKDGSWVSLREVQPDIIISSGSFLRQGS